MIFDPRPDRSGNWWQAALYARQIGRLINVQMDSVIRPIEQGNVLPLTQKASRAAVAGKFGYVAKCVAG